MTPSNNTWYVIVNPHSGSGKTMSLWSEAQHKLDALGIDYQAILTNHKSHATSLASAAARQGYRRILAVGGDGTLHEVFNGVLHWCREAGGNPEDFYLGVAPIGSGNDWIKSLGVPNDSDAVIDLISSGSFVREDVVRIESEGGGVCYMANIGGVGFDSRVCERVNRLKEAGHRSRMIYLNALRHTIFHARPFQVLISTDGRELFQGPCYSVAFGNGQYSGGGMRQVPLARMDDGLLDVMVVPKLPLGTIVKSLPRLFSGDLHKVEGLLYVQCREVSLAPLDKDSAELLEVDGEIEARLPVRLVMTGRQINVIARPERV